MMKMRWVQLARRGMFALLLPTPMLAQSAWSPATGVDPQVTVQIDRDDARGVWIYLYTVTNRAGAQQPISEVIFGARSAGIRALPPSGWRVSLFPDSSDVPGRGRIATARQAIPFEVDAPWDETTGLLRADRAQVAIQPGTSRSGFVLESADPPGFLTVYLRGFTPLVSENDLPATLPDWLADAKKVIVRGPVQRR